REQLDAVVGQEVKPAGGLSVTAATSPLGAAMRSDLVERARRYLAKVPAAVEGEGGHNQMFKAACVVMRLGLTQDEAMTVLAEWNERCQPPWQEKDLSKKTRDAAKTIGPRTGLLALPSRRGNDARGSAEGTKDGGAGKGQKIWAWDTWRITPT